MLGSLGVGPEFSWLLRACIAIGIVPDQVLLDASRLFLIQGLTEWPDLVLEIHSIFLLGRRNLRGGSQSDKRRTWCQAAKALIQIQKAIRLHVTCITATPRVEMLQVLAFSISISHFPPSFFPIYLSIPVYLQSFLSLVLCAEPGF